MEQNKLLKQLERTYLEELGRRFPILAVRGRLFTKENLDKAREIAKQRIQEPNPEKYLDGKIRSQPERDTKRYDEWREAVLVRDNYTCKKCRITEREIEEILVLAKKVGAVWFDRLEVCHIKPFSTHPQLRFDVNNGRTFCNHCHYQVV